MSIGAIYLLKPKTKKSNIYIQKVIEVSEKTAEFLIKNDFYKLLDKNKEIKELEVEIDGEIFITKINVLELDKHRSKIIDFIKKLIVNQLSQFNHKMSENELSFYNRLLFDLYKIYYSLTDYISYTIISMSESKILN